MFVSYKSNSKKQRLFTVYADHIVRILYRANGYLLIY